MKSRFLLVLACVGAVSGIIAASAALPATGPAPSPAAPAPSSSAQPATQPVTQRDESSYVQTAINAAIAAHRPLVLPSHQFFIGSTLTIEGASGFVMQGAGTPVSSIAPASNWSPKQSGTEFVWIGPNDRPMFDLHPAIGCSFRDLVFTSYRRGSPGATILTSPSALVRVANKSGWGSGNLYFENCCFASADVGLQLGMDAADFNCADVTLRDVQFSDCKTGLLTLNDQCVNLDLFDVIAFWGDRQSPCCIVNMVRGGNLRWWGGTGTLSGGSTVLKIEGAGDNAGTFLFSGQSWEHQGDYPILIDASHVGGTCRITAVDISDSSGGSNPANPNPGAFRVGPGVALTVSGSIFQRQLASMTGGDTAGRRSSLLVRDCTLPKPLSQLVKTDGGGAAAASPSSACRWRGEDNSTGWTNLPLPDEAGN